MTIDLAGRSKVHVMSPTQHINCYLFIGEITWQPKKVGHIFKADTCSSCIIIIVIRTLVMKFS